jgi:uncharacterized protein (DUF3084 family)
MKNISDVIKQKEREMLQKKNEIQQLESDIETLRAAARLLVDEGEAIPTRSTAAQNIAAAVAARPANGELKQFP